MKTENFPTQFYMVVPKKKEEKKEPLLLAHLAKGNESFCHHLASVIS